MAIISHFLGTFASDDAADAFIASPGWSPSDYSGMISTVRAPGLEYLNSVTGRVRTLTGAGWVEGGTYTRTYDVVESDFPAAVAAAGSLRRTLIIYKAMSVPSNVSVPSNIDLEFIRNGKLTVASGRTLTLACGVKAPNRQVFARADATASVVWDSSDILNVLWFGAVPGNSDDGSTAINFAIDSLPTTDGHIFFPPGRYRIEDTVSFRGKQNIWIDAHEANIYASGGTGFADKVVVDLVDCSDTTVFGLQCSTTGFAASKQPQAGFALGRSVSGVAAGSRMFFLQCRVTGKYTVGSVYESGAELCTFINCRFTNTENAPAYYEDSLDRPNICGRPGVNSSNTERYFIGCGFRSYIGDNDGRIIKFATGNRDIVFRSCYSSFSAGVGGRGKVIDISKDPLYDYGNCHRILVDDFRVEANDEALPLDQSDTRFIYIDNPNIITELTVRDLYFPVGEANPNPPDAIIEVRQGGLSGALLDVKDFHTAAVLLKIANTAVVAESKLVVPTADAVVVEAGASIQGCSIEVLDTLDTRHPVTGAGTIDNVEVNGQIYAKGQTAAGGGATIWERDLVDDRAYVVTAVVVGEQTDGAGRAMYGKSALFYRAGAGSVLEGAVQDMFPDVESDAGWDATFAVDGSNGVQLNVTGDATVTVNWTAKITVVEAPEA